MTPSGTATALLITAATRANIQKVKSMEALGQHWRGGDIANLKPARLFSPDRYNALLAPSAGSTRGYLDAQACGHPVIILLRLSKRLTHGSEDSWCLTQVITLFICALLFSSLCAL